MAVPVIRLDMATLPVTKWKAYRQHRESYSLTTQIADVVHQHDHDLGFPTIGVHPDIHSDYRRPLHMPIDFGGRTLRRLIRRRIKDDKKCRYSCSLRLSKFQMSTKSTNPYSAPVPPAGESNTVRPYILSPISRIVAFVLSLLSCCHCFRVVIAFVLSLFSGYIVLNVFAVLLHAYLCTWKADRSSIIQLLPEIRRIGEITGTPLNGRVAGKRGG
ncbi:MAG: hypothetical protein AAGA30_15875, partial [Planctomycetota bacterium]